LSRERARVRAIFFSLPSLPLPSNDIKLAYLLWRFAIDASSAACQPPFDNISRSDGFGGSTPNRVGLFGRWVETETHADRLYQRLTVPRNKGSGVEVSVLKSAVGSWRGDNKLA
jgi:hypothetical protein